MDTEDLRNSGYRGRVGTEDQRKSRNRGTEEQRKSRNRGTEEK